MQATGAQPEEGVDFIDSGDSLAAVKLVHQVSESFGAVIPIADFLVEPHLTCSPTYSPNQEEATE